MSEEQERRERAREKAESSASPTIQQLVRDDLVKREQLGIERYGDALHPHNGRNALQEAYEEALDLACYLKQALLESDPDEWYAREVERTKGNAPA